MRSIYLLRHASPEPETNQTGDRDRVLSKAGLREANLIGDYMRTQHLLPEQVLCSPARRAIETLEALGGFSPTDPGVQIEERLYLASSGQLVERLRELEPHCSSALVVAHNPGLADLVHSLAQSERGSPDAERGSPDAKRGNPKAIARLGHSFPPAAFAVFRLNATRWGALSSTSSYLEAFTTPRFLEK